MAGTGVNGQVSQNPWAGYEAAKGPMGDGAAPSLSAPIYPDPGMDYSLAREEARRIMDALGRARGSREQAAAELGISKTTLWRRMKKLGIR